MKWIRAAIVIALMAINHFTPWWSVAVSGGVLGLIFGGRWRQWLELGALCGLSWFLPVLFVDARDGFRISLRVAGVLGLPSRLLVYVVILLLASVLGALAATIGSALRETLTPSIWHSWRVPLHPEDTLAD